MLKARGMGRINTRMSYRIPSRRPSRINTRLRKSVALATSKQYRFTDLENFINTGPVGQCAWGQVAIGDAAHQLQFFLHVKNNYVGYKVEDYNTILGSNQSKLKVHVDSMYSKTMFINETNHKVHVELYEFTPRHDIHGDLSSTWSPYALLTTQAQAGDLYDNVQTEVPNPPNQMLYTDPRFTPYMCPRLLMTYKMSNVRKFTVHGGASWDVTVSNNNFDITYFNDMEDESLTAKKGKYKVVLYKVYGELGVAENGDGTIRGIRHMPFSYVAKTDYMVKGRVTEDARTIYQDNNINRNQTGGYENAEFIKQETLDKSNADAVSANTTG